MMKKWMIVVNSILAFPFIYILLCAGLSYITDLLHCGSMLNGDLTGLLIGAPLLLAYVGLPSLGIFLLPLLTALSGFSLWKTWPHRRTLLIFYLSVYLLYDIYVIWWYASGQKMNLEL